MTRRSGGKKSHATATHHTNSKFGAAIWLNGYIIQCPKAGRRALIGYSVGVLLTDGHGGAQGGDEEEASDPHGDRG